MKIVNVVCSKGRTGFFFDDQKAIKAGAGHDGAAYVGAPMTPGFHAIRQAGEAISVMLVLEDGQVACGDCAAVQYSGAGGRDPLFLAEDFIPVILEHLKPLLVGRELDQFLPLAREIDGFHTPDGKRLHTAVRYGVSQALLDAVAKARHEQMCDVIAREYHTEVQREPVAIFTQSGDSRYENVDKMILKGADVLPHGLINNMEKIGEHGEVLLEYVGWLRERVAKLGVGDYHPVLHIDVYGMIGVVFGAQNTGAIVDYLQTLEAAAAPLTLRIEGPVDVGERTAQMQALAAITAELDRRGSSVQIVADEWCNTFEDVKYFADNRAGHMIQIKAHGMGAYQGGTCNETDRSAQVCVHVAMAVHPVQILAKPGMGVDEGFMIVYNEMQRILALKNAN